MSKLILEDDKGVQHDLTLKHIPHESVSAGDTLIIEYEIGRLGAEPSTEDVNMILTQLKTMIQATFPEGVKIIVVAVRDGKEDVKIRIIKEGEKSE